MYTPLSLSIYIYVYMYVCMYIYIYIYIYMYIYIHGWVDRRLQRHHVPRREVHVLERPKNPTAVLRASAHRLQLCQAHEKGRGVNPFCGFAFCREELFPFESLGSVRESHVIVHASIVVFAGGARSRTTRRCPTIGTPLRYSCYY